MRRPGRPLCRVQPGRLLGLERADGLTIWRKAASDGFALVTQDADFQNLSALYGAPPKVVLVRCGNQPTAVIERLLRANAIRLFRLRDEPDANLLEIG